ncbi:hypothetical protein AK812_SmicGene28321 [Symbiodinium microadriaticum]|uniref:Uncharacterized protein n=1 Tax=Symbiodinium microadriaticum TaxID=2951 RepID=A0A1Q9D4X5_SYMMI|nr:hypothetical protein AK812_SmicGene28321 [Symbiodinium microadriaticum]
MAVRVEKKTCISFKSDRFSLLPDSLLEKHGDEDFLRLRPTNQVLLTVLYGEAPPKNASISSSSALKKLLELRKEALDARDQGEGAGEHAPPESLFENNEAKPAKKRRVIKKPLDEDGEVLTITVDEVSIRTLVKGSRPSRSDFIVSMEAGMLQKVFTMLSDDLDECFHTAKRKLYLLLLYENMDDRSWRADVLSLTLWGVLAPTRSGSYILPFRQPEERRPLMTVHRETLRVFEGISEEVSSRRRELQRRFAAQ